jgi:hypothetical protein
VRFSPELRGGVADGDITVSIRFWQRAQVRAGGRYESDGSLIEVDSVELLPFSAVTADDVARSGEPDREALRRRAAHAGPVHDDTLVHRIEFHLVRQPAGQRVAEAPDPSAARPASRRATGTRKGEHDT